MNNPIWLCHKNPAPFRPSPVCRSPVLSHSTSIFFHSNTFTHTRSRHANELNNTRIEIEVNIILFTCRLDCTLIHRHHYCSDITTLATLKTIFLLNYVPSYLDSTYVHLIRQKTTFYIYCFHKLLKLTNHHIRRRCYTLPRGIKCYFPTTIFVTTSQRVSDNGSTSYYIRYWKEYN